MGKEKIELSSLLIMLVLVVMVSYVFLFDVFDFEEGQSGKSRMTEFLQEQIGSAEISYYIDSLPYNVDGKYINSIREAISYWEKREDVVFKEVVSESEANVRINWVKEFGGEHIGYAYDKSFIEIGLGDSLCLSKWRVYKYESVLQIAIHEVGHVIGKEHSEDSRNVMYPMINTKYEIDVEEVEVLPDGWFRFYPTCTRGDVAEYLFEVTSDEKLNVYIVPSMDEFNKLEVGEEFNHYVDCSESEITNYKNNCVIDSGGGIILENPSVFGLGSSAQFEIKVKEI